MKKTLSCAILFALTAAIPAFADVTVNSPSNGAQVPSSFNLNAYASNCSGQPVSTMGVSWDSSSQTSIVNGSSINATASGGSGWHTLHVKAWGNQGAACITDVSIDVTDGASSSAVPSGATTVSSVQTLGSWKAVYDTGTNGGGASGWMAMSGSPSRSGNARRFVTSYSNNGGERYDASFGDDTNAQNFFYDAWVYLDGTHNNIGNLEMDMNQTMANGQTAIFGFQCDGWTSTWDYTKNAGSQTSPNDTWVHSNQYCNPRTWSINTWHHVQISYSRTVDGWITYKSVWLDGKEQPINATVLGAFALGWGPTLLTNFQVDGQGSGGTASVYLDNLTISRW